MVRPIVKEPNSRILDCPDIFKNLYWRGDWCFSKPNRKAFEYVLRDLDAAASDVLMVGDSIENDIDGAEQAGINAVLIDRGNRYSEHAGTRIVTLSS